MDWFKNRNNLAFLFFCLFAIAGIVFAAYLVALDTGATTSEFCSINETFDCAAVSQSKYAKLLGLPVALYGLVAYGLMLAGMIFYYFKKNETVLTLVGTLVLVALAFSLYLTGVEAFILKAWCILCIGSQISVIGMLVSYFLYRKFELKN
jgi:vitamin-K-epoxide reductase (warfarin-sensitive)